MELDVSFCCTLEIHSDVCSRTAYVMVMPCFCRRNCKGNPNCLVGIGEQAWLGEIDENAFHNIDDPNSERRDKVCLPSVTHAVNCWLIFPFFLHTASSVCCHWKLRGCKDFYKDSSLPPSLSISLSQNTFVGLTNLGATCYVNTFLQVWFHNLELRRSLYQCHNSRAQEHNIESGKYSSCFFVFVQCSGLHQDVSARYCKRFVCIHLKQWMYCQLPVLSWRFSASTSNIQAWLSIKRAFIVLQNCI